MLCNISIVYFPFKMFSNVAKMLKSPVNFPNTDVTIIIKKVL